MHAVGRGVCRAAGNVAQAQLRGSCRPALVPAAAQHCNPVQHLLKQPIATHLHLQMNSHSTLNILSLGWHPSRC